MRWRHGQATSVAPSDLNRNGNFWRSLTGDLKLTLTEDCKQRLARQRPEAASLIEAESTEPLIRRIDLQFENTAKRTHAIYETCADANDELAGEKLKSLAPALEAQSEGE
jgi:hypothetical protein